MKTRALRTRAAAIITMAALLTTACGTAATSASTSASTSEGSAEAASDTTAVASATESSQNTDTQTASAAASGSSQEMMGAAGGKGGFGGAGGGGGVDKSGDEELQTLISDVAGKFSQVDYTDSETGLTVTYNIYLPEDYDASKEYPMVVFIADSSVANGDAEASLTQGYGALVWASEDFQSTNESIVLVPTYPETILDDHSGYTTTDYVELTYRLIEDVAAKYSVNKIYGTGQSMGCMTTLILASEHPDLYAACMFVDGQWDVSTLKSLENQKFVYFAAEGDVNAYAGMQEVESMLDTDSVSYATAQFDATWSDEELENAEESLLSQNSSINMITWKKGTVLPEGTAEGTSEHMYAFDYAYQCTAIMKWLMEQ